MGKRDKKKIRHSGAAAPKAEAQQQSPDFGEHTGGRRLVVWSVAAVVIIAAAVVAWWVTRDGSSPAVATTEIHKSGDPLPSPATADGVAPDSGVSLARLEIPEVEFDFGFVPQKAKVSHVFWLHAAGEDTLRILKVNPG